MKSLVACSTHTGKAYKSVISSRQQWRRRLPVRVCPGSNTDPANRYPLIQSIVRTSVHETLRWHIRTRDGVLPRGVMRCYVLRGTNLVPRGAAGFLTNRTPRRHF